MPKRIVRATNPRKPSSSPPKYETVPVDTLQMYYENPRIGNVEKVAESLKANTQFKPIVVNVGTYTGRKREILAGNHTWLGTQKLGRTEIDVRWVDVDEARARAIVLADNGSTDDATYDNEILSKLLDMQMTNVGTLVGTTYTEDIMDKLMVEVNTDPMSKIDKISDAPSDLDGIADLNNYRFFESDDDLDIPEILLDMIPDEFPQPIDIWAGYEVDLPRQESNPGQWWLANWHSGCRFINWKQAICSMYTEDFHFEGCYTEPAVNAKKILNLGIPMAIAPNFSINEDWPIALWIMAAYKSKYVARYWQEAGIQVIPDIQYGGTDAALDLSLRGVPVGSPVVACQVQNARGDTNKIRTIARLLKQAEDRIGWRQILVYGHIDADKVMERADLSSDIIRVETRTARRRPYLDSGVTVNTPKRTRKSQ